MAEEDIIYGKKRHFFGGIEPSNMCEFTVTKDDEHVVVRATLPEDTVIDNQTLCTVAGAVIRRRTDDFPKDEFDGDLVLDTKQSTAFVDEDAVADRTYFYAAFPYTTQGVYNRSSVNRVCYNKPDDMHCFFVTTKTDKSGKTYNDVRADIAGNVSGAVIRKSTTGFPVDENDGEFVFEVVKSLPGNNAYNDYKVEDGQFCYYSAFPYTADGNYTNQSYNRDAANENSKNRAFTITGVDNYLYGYDLEVRDGYNAVTYPSDVQNSSFTAARMNYDGDYFMFSNWSVVQNPGTHFMPKPCMVDPATDSILCYLDSNDYSKKEDGTTASQMSNIAYNCMMEWPKIYTKRWIDENGIYHFRCSNMKVDHEYDCWCNYDKNNNEIDHFYTSVYNGTVHNSTLAYLRSSSGRSIIKSQSPSTLSGYAVNNGSDWTVGVASDWMLINDLLVMMAKDTDCQGAYGLGYTKSSYSNGASYTGTMDKKGMFYGDKTGDCGVKVFGMEHYWGNYKQVLLGLIFNGNADTGQLTIRYKATRGNHDGTDLSEYYMISKDQTAINKYHKQNFVVSVTGTSYGYISKCAVTKFGRIPCDVGGDSISYEADSLHWSTTGKNYITTFGGFFSIGTQCGPFCIWADDSATSSSQISAGLSYKPSVS